MNYRPEIDGLRAVAVVPVIFFHAGFSAFGGGYVGVDVFFVISGYLITSIIIQERSKGTFTILSFYERRARRILPALFLVMLSTIPFAWLWMWPTALRDFSNSLIAVATFVSNILFWQERGYFDAVAELKPLLHTWSLAVEEQFYLFFPLAFALIWRFSSRWRFGLIAFAAIVSFCLAEWASVSRPGAAFFLIFFRAWELLLGSLAALYLTKLDEGGQLGRNREIPAAVGLLLIAVAVFTFDALTPFPGIYALIPTLGTLLIILFATSETFVGRLLSWKLPVGIGLISYSAYLWHQPMLALARHRSVAEPDQWVRLAICLAVFPLAYLSWLLVEKPFRDRKTISRSQVFAFSLAGSILFIAVGIAGNQFNHLGKSLPPNVKWEEMGHKVATIGEVCDPELLDGSPGVVICFFGDVEAEKTVALYGDSHARALGWSLDREFARRGLRGVFVAIPGCETVPGVMESRRATLNTRESCKTAFAGVLRYFEQKTWGVIVSSRWTYFLYPISGVIDSLGFDNGEGGHDRNTVQKYGTLDKDGRFDLGADGKRQAIRDFLQGLGGLSQRVVIVHPVPEIGWDIAKLNSSHFDSTGVPLDSISFDYRLYKERNSFIESIFEEHAGIANFRFVRPAARFCDTYIPARCVAQFNTVPFYDDDDHLSDAGAEMVVADILRSID